MSPSSHRHSGSGASLSTIIKSALPIRNANAQGAALSLLPFLILASIVIASATQTEVAHWLVASAGYNQPYFTFFLTHVTFSFVFPVHLVLLHLLHAPSRGRIPGYIDTIRSILADQLGLFPDSTWTALAPAWTRKLAWLTALISVPALSWFVAMLYSPAMDITAIYATSSFWAYFFSMWMLGQPLSRITAGSIALAFLGVVVLSLDGLGEGDEQGGKGRAFGDLVMMLGAILLGLYEVVYKLILPEGHGGVASSAQHESSRDLNGTSYAALQHDEAANYPYEPTPPASGSATPTEARPPTHAPRPVPPTRISSRGTVIPLSPTSPSSSKHPASSSTGDRSVPDRIFSSTPLLDQQPASHASRAAPMHTHHHPASPLPTSPTTSLPPALHANFLTSCIGVATLIMLWPPLILLHWTGWEIFRWPAGEGVSSWTVWGALEVVAWSGAIYNAGLMILIGVWGPTTSSVANLLTIGLVAVIDAVLVGLLPSWQTLIGVGMICVGFGILLYEGEG